MCVHKPCKHVEVRGHRAIFSFSWILDKDCQQVFLSTILSSLKILNAVHKKFFSLARQNFLANKNMKLGE